VSCATGYLQKLGQQGKAAEEEVEGGGSASAGPAQAYADATYRRIFHCIELFADHPRYKAAIIRPGTTMMMNMLNLILLEALTLMPWWGRGARHRGGGAVVLPELADGRVRGVPQGSQPAGHHRPSAPPAHLARPSLPHCLGAMTIPHRQ
jgi:hypothetical protein